VLGDLRGSDFGFAEAHKLYACHDLLLAHKQALFTHLTERWRDLFNASFDVCRRRSESALIRRRGRFW
jgi:hypothetical protein